MPGITSLRRRPTAGIDRLIERATCCARRDETRRRIDCSSDGRAWVQILSSSDFSSYSLAVVVNTARSEQLVALRTMKCSAADGVIGFEVS